MYKYIYILSTDKIFQKFDNYEIMPCVFLGEHDSGSMYESCDAKDSDIAIWCVYGHFKTGGLECISDHQTYNEAKLFMETLPQMPLVPLTPF